MKGIKVLLLAVVLIAFTLGAIPALAGEGRVWVESSSPWQIRVGYSGFEPLDIDGYHPGHLYINENDGTRSVALYKPEGDPGFLHGDIYDVFDCDSPKVIVSGVVYGTHAETYYLPEIEVACHVVRLPLVIQP